MKANTLFKKLSFSAMLVLSFTFSGIMNSCSNNEDAILSEEEQLKLQEQELLTIEENNDTDYLLPNGEYSFIYEGNSYTYTLENGTVECDNETRKILDYLQSLGDKLITVVNEDETIEYYTSEKEYNKRFINTRAEEERYRTTSLTLYRNKNYWGSREHYYYDSRNGDTKTNTGVSWGISSLKAKVDHVDVPLALIIRIQFFDQNNLTGRMIQFHISKSEFNENNLKDVPLYPGSSENWNDRIKSLKLY